MVVNIVKITNNASTELNFNNPEDSKYFTLSPKAERIDFKTWIPREKRIYLYLKDLCWLIYDNNWSVKCESQFNGRRFEMYRPDSWFNDVHIVMTDSGPIMLPIPKKIVADRFQCQFTRIVNRSSSTVEFYNSEDDSILMIQEWAKTPHFHSHVPDKNNGHHVRVESSHASWYFYRDKTTLMCATGWGLTDMIPLRSDKVYEYQIQIFNSGLEVIPDSCGKGFLMQEPNSNSLSDVLMKCFSP
ncbi:hypothetical protein HK096_010325, partial [Nowakowskiella sp. JEL0078]